VGGIVLLQLRRTEPAHAVDPPNGVNTNYLYDGKWENVIEEVDSSGVLLARYSQQEGLDLPLSESEQGGVSYYQQDGGNSITSLSNSSGALANTYTYGAFGNLIASTGTVTNPFQFTAREFDPETGIYEYRARYYQPNLGRFLSEDPAGFSGGTDFYASSEEFVGKFRLSVEVD